MHAYMRYQFHLLKTGKLKKRDIGGWAWKLPKASDSGEPAPLPDEVIDFQKRQATDKRRSDKRARQSSSQSDIAEDPRYSLEFQQQIRIF